MCRKVVADSSGEEETEEQPVFHGHAPACEALEDKNRGSHHVVVPYSPLMYQRFYDWPPESQYARVKADRKAPPMLPVQQQRKNATLHAQAASPPRAHALTSSLPLPPPRTRTAERRGQSLPIGSRGRFASAYLADPEINRQSFKISPETEQAWIHGNEHKKKN